MTLGTELPSKAAQWQVMAGTNPPNQSRLEHPARDGPGPSHQAVPSPSGCEAVNLAAFSSFVFYVRTVIAIVDTK